MPKTDLVPCFYWGQDSQNDEPAKTLTRSEVHQLKKENRGFFIDHGHSFRLTDPAPSQSKTRDLLDTSGQSTACISFEEMQANVGIVAEGTKNPQSVRARAQAKIRWYPHIRTFPELASGRWVQFA